MAHKTGDGSWVLWVGGALLVVASLPSQADVTMQQTISLDAAGIVKMNGSSTEYTGSDRQRKDSSFRCEGLMSLVCGKADSGEIIRLDRDLQWQLHPDKKSYLETPFPTAAERALAQQKMQETLDKMKQCQAQQPARPAQKAADTSKCEMSPPKLDVKQTDEHLTLIGHDARKTSVRMSQTCTDTQTGDVCEMVYGFDVWLTSDAIAGSEDRHAFEQAYLRKMGLDQLNPATQGAVSRFMGQYSDMLKTLAGKAGDFKGYPLRTTFRFTVGGEKCGRARQSDSQSGSSDASSQSAPVSPTAGGLGGLAANAIGGKLIGGLFGRKNSAGSSSSSGADPNAPEPAAPGAAPSLQVIAFTTDTTGISTAAIPASQFEIPAGWVPEHPAPSKDREFTCPTEGK
jgi:hypothetical protein